MEFNIEFFSSLTNYIPTAVVLVLLLAILLMGNRPKFISLHIFVNFCFGIGFGCFPRCMLGFMLTDELDEVAAVCSQVFGMSLIAISLVWFLTRETRDGTVPITLMTAQVFSSSVMLLCQVYTQFGERHRSPAKGKDPVNPWSDQHIWFGMVGSASLLLSNLIFLLRSHDFSSYPQHNIRVNEFLRLDAGLAMLLALTCLAFPDLVHRHFFPSTKLMSPVAKHLIRCAGTQVMGSAFISLQAAGFLHEKDKKKQFITRLVSIPLLFIPFIVGAVMRDQFTLQQIEWAILSLVPLTLNAILGVFAEGTISSVPSAAKYK